jgi:hypothetical protein
MRARSASLTCSIVYTSQTLLFNAAINPAPKPTQKVGQERSLRSEMSRRLCSQKYTLPTQTSIIRGLGHAGLPKSRHLGTLVTRVVAVSGFAMNYPTYLRRQWKAPRLRRRARRRRTTTKGKLIRVSPSGSTRLPPSSKSKPPPWSSNNHEFLPGSLAACHSRTLFQGPCKTRRRVCFPSSHLQFRATHLVLCSRNHLPALACPRFLQVSRAPSPNHQASPMPVPHTLAMQPLSTPLTSGYRVHPSLGRPRWHRPTRDLIFPILGFLHRSPCFNCRPAWGS